MSSTPTTSTFFHDFGLPEPVLLALGKMKFDSPTPIQAAAIPAALSGRDVLGLAQTGTGKTAAFAIPALASVYRRPGTQALVLAPTRELAAQIFKVFKQLSQAARMRGTLVVGGESFGKQARELREGVDFLIATPGRLVDHLDQGKLDLRNVSVVVFDEVDRTLDMGFLPQIQQIMKRIPKQRQTLLFSATLPVDREKIVASFLDNPARVSVGATSQPVHKIRQEKLETSPELKPGLLIEELEKREGKVLVFTRTQSRTERVARWLEKEGFKVSRLHGGRTQGQRRTAMEAFRSGAARILVATDLAGRGIDVNDVAHVINYDLPASREDYVHRIGRTGRFGREGTATTFFCDAERGELASILNEPRPKSTPKPGPRRSAPRPQGSPFKRGGSFRAAEDAGHGRPGKPRGPRPFGQRAKPRYGNGGGHGKPTRGGQHYGSRHSAGR